MAENFDEFTDPPFEWGDQVFDGPSAPYSLVTSRFDSTIATAEEMLERLVGTDGESGYLGELNSIITSLSVPDIDDFSIEIPTISVTPMSRPSLDLDTLETDFPTFDTASPSLTSLPTVDLSSIVPADLPADVEALISWVEQSHDTTLYTDLLTRIRADLTSGATGLDSTVEEEIWDRALARQAVENDRLYEEIDEYFSSRGFDLPTGAHAARLAEAANQIALSNEDLNGKIAIEQAQLAQRNSQFIIQAANTLEQVLRGFTDTKNNRALDYAKAVAAQALGVYAEKVKAYVAAMEANKAYVEVQVENLKGAVEYNKGLVAQFQAEADAYKTIIDAKKAKNDGVIEAFKADVLGYDAETRAISDGKRLELEELKLKLDNADLQLRQAIAQADADLKAYGVESSLREKVAESMANIAMQAMASAYGAVNASAGISYTGSESQSESVSHSESRDAGYSRSDSRSETHQYSEV